MSTAQITTRPATDDELAELRRRRSSVFGYIGCWLVVAVTLGSQLSLLTWVLVDLGYAWLGVLVGVLIATVGVGWWARINAPGDRRLKSDLRTGNVEVITVEGALPRLVLAEDSSVDPTLVFDLGDAGCLLLIGQWMHSEMGIFGEPDSAHGSGDPDENILNGLDAPYSFPSSAFTIRRFAASGIVLGVEVRGDYVAPSGLDGVDVRGVNGYQSLRVECGLPQVQTMLDAIADA